MVLKHREPSPTQARGTIIDLESIGEFDRNYPPWDPRQYANITPTIFGYITDNTLTQHCAEGIEDLPKIKTTMKETLPSLEEPFYALNTHFERCIIENTCNLQPPFIDVRGNLRGSKWTIREQLGIPTYDDPFNGNGYQCIQEWQKGNYKECLQHNRACLLIEQDIQTHIKNPRPSHQETKNHTRTNKKKELHQRKRRYFSFFSSSGCAFTI